MVPEFEKTWLEYYNHATTNLAISSNETCGDTGATMIRDLATAISSRKEHLEIRCEICYACS